MPGFPEAGWYESCCHIEGVCGSIKLRFGFGGRDVADGLEQAAVIEPVDPFERRMFDRLERTPRPTPVDQLGLVEAVDRLGQGVVITVADAAVRRLDPGLCQALGQI